MVPLAPLLIVGSGLGLLVSQLNNYTLAPISEEGVSEAAGVNSAAGSFGLSFGLAFAGAIMLATLSLSFSNLAAQSTVLSPTEQQQVAQVLEHDAQVLSNAQLEQKLVGQPKSNARRDRQHQHRGQTRRASGALLVPLFAGLLGLFNSFRMMRLPDPPQSAETEGLAPG